MKIIFIASIFYLSCIIPSYASGFGWYVSSFDWNDFTKQIKILNNKKTEEQKNILADQIIDAMIPRSEDQTQKVPFSFLSIEESPMNSLEFYWEESLLYANKELTKKGIINNYFTRFNTSKSSIILPKEIINHSFSPYFFVLSPKDIQKFYNQLKMLSSNTTYPKDYKPDLLHMEGVLLKNSVNGERGLVFFGHD
ncbi:hypothetical protein [Halarcobacter sp.]|uniref:hypothetical protein n=1 Tax=Halarcobacter sp. TaxID=2321133 RepID=UPI0029F4A9BE|nr:hypothetical protein [Halarcobacter sp.]